MSRFLNAKYRTLKPYAPGEQPESAGIIKLNTNESPFPPCGGVVEAISSAETERLNLYPDPDAKALIKALSDYHGAPACGIMAGNGSDELLAFSFMAFPGENRKIYFPDISYGFYEVYAEIFGADAHPVPLDENLSIRIEDYYNLDGMIVIANPNAQTGAAISRNDIEKILRTGNRDNLVLIDEAYVDFGAESSLRLLDRYDNLLVIQTFSKSRNLAGARIGAAFASKGVIEDLSKIKYSFNSYNLSRLSILAGVAAIEDTEYFKECTGEIKKTRAEFVNNMEALGFSVIPSLANFVLARHGGISGEAYYNELRRRNILVRHFNSERIKDYVRITIGSRADMDALIEATKAILS